MTVVITDLGLLRPDPAGGREFVLVAVHPGVAPEHAIEATGWPLKVASDLAVTEPPTSMELRELLSLTEAGVA